MNLSCHQHKSMKTGFTYLLNAKVLSVCLGYHGNLHYLVKTTSLLWLNNLSWQHLTKLHLPLGDLGYLYLHL